jgi:hypothetical protein
MISRVDFYQLNMRNCTYGFPVLDFDRDSMFCLFWSWGLGLGSSLLCNLFGAFSKEALIRGLEVGGLFLRLNKAFSRSF